MNRTAGMHVLQVNTYAGGGGAAIAAQRLNEGLNRAGIDSRFLAMHLVDRKEPAKLRLVRTSGSFRERLWRRLRRSQLNRVYRRLNARADKRYPFSSDLSADGMALLGACDGVDILNFHWVSNLLDYPFVLPRLSPAVPLVWTLHDMNTMTGGCHYALDCRAFHEQCGKCPVLGSSATDDLSHQIWKRKKQAFLGLRAQLTVVTPSGWLAREVQQSSLLKGVPVHCIPNSLDVDLFRPTDRRNAKQLHGFDPDLPVVLFVAAALDNPLKGLGHLADALPQIRSRHPGVQFLAAGKLDREQEWSLHVHEISAQTPEGMAKVYACADVIVVPSLADNLPNVILEAMACGVPAVGFEIGGIPEAIGRDGTTGLLAADMTSEALADAVSKLLTQVMGDSEDWQQRCRSRAEKEFALNVQAGRYASLYGSLLESPAAHGAGTGS